MTRENCAECGEDITDNHQADQVCDRCFVTAVNMQSMKNLADKGQI